MRRGAATLLLAMLATVAACSGADDAGAERPAPDQLTAAEPAPRRTDCVVGGGEAMVRPNEDAGPLCLRVGATLRINSTPAGGAAWRPLVSSDATVLGCESTVGSAGTVSGVCTARAAGTTIVSTQTRAPASGASDHWRLTVAVIA